MKKKLPIIVITSLGFALLATSVPVSINILKASNVSTVSELSSLITPSSPGRGETINCLPSSLTTYWEKEDLLNTYAAQAPSIGELTPYSAEMASWVNMPTSTPTEKAARAALFKKYDIYLPTNNILAWNSEVTANEYRVIISQDKSFKNIEREYVVSGTESSVVFANPYSGTTYYWQVIASKSDGSKVYSDIFNFITASLPRTVSIEGTSNTRDFGGNVGANSKRIKEGLIYRGTGLESISEAGTNEFKNNLGITTEIDLRGIGEGTENYLSLPNYYHCSSPYDYVTGYNSPNCIGYFGEGSLVTSFGNAIKALANKNNYPVYFHCSVGRDRTGWLGLCLNFLCGVSEEVTLKEYCLSLFSAAGGLAKGNVDLYNRYIRIRDYINTYSGNNLSEKMENYLVTHAGVTHQECENVRGILLGDIDTGFVPGKENPTPLTNMAKVTFRKYGSTSIIKMVEKGSLLEKPSLSEKGDWYHGEVIWDFDNDVVTDDIYLDFISKENSKIFVTYSGLELPNETFEVKTGSLLDYSRFIREGYNFKVYDDSYNYLETCLVNDDMRINVIYSPINGYIPKSNSRIIVMAGQSNGAGVGHYEYLSNSLDEDKIEEINNGYDNVLLTGYSHGAVMDDFRKVYADKDYNTASSPGTFGFEVGLADRLSKAFPNETTYLVKYAYGGASLNFDWISPSARDEIEVVQGLDFGLGERGWLYDGMEECLTNTITKITETTNTIPMIEAFMWMQGESDAAFELATNLYLRTFDILMDDFLTTFKDNISYKFALYDAGISETALWDFAKPMNDIKRSRCDDKNIYIDTNARLTTLFEPMGSVTDAAHYDAACYIDLGHMFADAYLEKTVKGYTHNSLEIEEVNKITITKGETLVIKDPKVYFNGEVVDAKLSYFAEQHRGVNDYVYHYFVVNDDGTLTATRVGNSQLRITAYYQDEVRTILVPVEVVS